MRREPLAQKCGLIGLILLGGCGGHHAPSTAACPNVLPESCPSSAPTYRSDVAPTIAARCQRCHEAGGQAGYLPLVTYDDIYSRRQDVLSVLHDCIMPPDSEAQPSDHERQLVLSWLVCGAEQN